MLHSGPKMLFLSCAAGGLIAALGCSGQTTLAPTAGDTTHPVDTTSVVSRPRIDSTTGAIIVYPGDNIQQLVDSARPGASFLLKAGTHRQQRVVPKDSMSFAGEPGAIMDGENITPYAFETLASTPRKVTIRGLVITRYAPPAQRAAIQGDNGTDWIIEDNEVSYSAYEGIHPGTRGQVLRNRIHDNTVGGIGGYESDSVLIDGNELAFNGLTMTAENPATAEAAGLKFMNSNGLVVRNNNVHDNMRGLWIDTGYLGTLLDSNIVTGNQKAGIWIEATYGAVVRNNRVENNGGTTTGGWLAHAGIQVTNSPNVEVYGNTLSGNMNGVGVMETSGYPDGPYGPLHVVNLYVHDNTISMATGNTGLDENVGDSTVFTSKNNRFAHNSYVLGAASGFAWSNKTGLTVAQWKTYGQDSTGTFQQAP